MADTHARSFTKSMTWRITATMTTMLRVFFFTGNIVLSVSIGIVETITKLLIFYAHERAWTMTKWGIRNE